MLFFPFYINKQEDKRKSALFWENKTVNIFIKKKKMSDWTVELIQNRHF